MSSLLLAVLVASRTPRQPVAEIQGRWKLVLRKLDIPKLPRDAYLVISQPWNGDGPISVRLGIHGRTRSRSDLPATMFNSRTETRLFRRGGDTLLAFGSGTGTTLLTNFVRIEASPIRLTSETSPEGSSFEYAPLHHFQADGRFDEHIRHWDELPGLYTRHWLWSKRKHKFVVTGHTRLTDWGGWDDLSLR